MFQARKQKRNEKSILTNNKESPNCIVVQSGDSLLLVNDFYFLVKS